MQLKNPRLSLLLLLRLTLVTSSVTCVVTYIHLAYVSKKFPMFLSFVPESKLVEVVPRHHRFMEINYSNWDVCASYGGKEI